MIPEWLPSGFAALALLLPATALAAGTTVSGAKSDPKGDQPLHGDVLSATASYNSSGRLKAKVGLASYAEAAEHRTVVGAFFAKRRGGRCDTSEGAAITVETDTKVASALVLPGAGEPAKANVRVERNAVGLSIRDRQFARKGYNCVVVLSLAPTGATTSDELDRISFRLKAKRRS